MPTANEDYWNNLRITDLDVERLYNFVFERAEPVATLDLVQHLIETRVRDEEERRARYVEDTAPYQPKRQYAVGQHMVFAERQDARGEVVAARPGDNPRLPPFQVITVRFEGEGRTYDFASAYELPHPLNEDRAASEVSTDLSPVQVLDEYGARIDAAVLLRLHRDREFVEREGKWLLRGLVVPVHEGYLNLAEAAIEQANNGVSTDELMQILEFHPEGVKRSTVAFSLESALANDARFVNVGPRGEARWFLSRLQPTEAREVPRILQMAPPPGPFELPPELEAFVEQLEGRADVTGAAAPSDSLVPVVTLTLTYPHRRQGTMPLTAAVRALFPETEGSSLMINVVDESSGARMPAWVVPQGNYIAGFKGLYDQRKLNPGAHLQLTKRAEPLTLSLDYQPQRERSLWVRVARTENGQLTFTQLRKPIAHKYDEEMLILIGDPAGIDNLHAERRFDRPLETLLSDIFPELAKLVPGGRVHAKTVFAATNFARRVGPRAVFTALVQSAAFISTGGGYFVMETARDLVR